METTGSGLKGSWLCLLQLIPLLVVVAFATACGNDSSLGDLFASRETNLFLKGFLDMSANGNSSQYLTEWKPRKTNENSDGTYKITYDQVSAHLMITNGVSAKLENIKIKFMEVDGSDLLDFTLTPPMSTAGKYDFQIKSSLSLEATPITSITPPLSEPIGVPTNFYIPLNLYQTYVYSFQLTQPDANIRPILANVTFTGQDILSNSFSIAGYLLLSPFLRTSN